jgi:hypothetical protein
MTDPVRGAVYVPARAFNAYQAWHDYDPGEARRDLGYAASLDLNALRLWLSFEHWTDAPAAHLDAFDDLLAAAAERGIRILPALFESCGVEPTPEALRDRHPATALCVRSPSVEIHRNPARWHRPLAFVENFMARYADDPRLLAVEIMNEPWLADGRMSFTRALFERAAALRASVPLTVGSDTFRNALFFMDLGLDVLQHHSNFPAGLDAFQCELDELRAAARTLGRPVWLTEWQRLRTGPSGWGEEPLASGEWQPAYATLAHAVRASGIPGFFWSLMIKPAYLAGQRAKGTLNGVFHEDGAVWSLDDARAISGDPDFSAPERKTWPDWARGAPRPA